MTVIDKIAKIPSSDMRNILTVLGFFLTILIYFFERRYKYKTDRTKSKKDWFLNIVLSPQLEQLNEFYDQVLNNLEESINRLVDNQIEGASDTLMLINKRIEIAKFKKFRKDYFNNFSASIRSFDGDLANKFDEIINEVDDIYSRELEKNKLIKNRMHNVIPLIYKNKSEAYRVLFSVIDDKMYKKLMKKDK
tara:strand:+ start:7191 stop:7766 length:576 start_codon:yes stop_codon:yes gene_type:complete